MKIFEINGVKFYAVNSMWERYLEELVIGNEEYGTALIPDEDEDLLYVQHIDGSAKSIRVKVIWPLTFLR